MTCAMSRLLCDVIQIEILVSFPTLTFWAHGFYAYLSLLWHAPRSVREKITGFLVLPPNFKTVQCFYDPFSDFPEIENRCPWDLPNVILFSGKRWVTQLKIDTNVMQLAAQHGILLKTLKSRTNLKFWSLILEVFCFPFTPLLKFFLFSVV